MISFGTSGWRGIIAEEFTFAGVRAVSAAIAESVGPGETPLLVGYDTRFLSRRFAEAAAAMVHAAGRAVLFSADPVPTPVVSFEIRSRKLVGGINITASHNPAEYNGIKFSPAWGGPALPAETKKIERRANELLRKGDLAAATLPPSVKGERLGAEYRKHLLEKILDVRAFSGAPSVAIDLFWGTAQGYLDTVLKEMGVSVRILHDGIDPLFGGIRPDPEGESLKLLREEVRRHKCLLGIGADCDADRFGIVDRGGEVVPPNLIIALLLDYLVVERKMTGPVARSVATSHLVDRVAKLHGLPVIETPVGFKYLGEMIAADRILLGGEESGGISIRGHVPEKDGIAAGLLVAEMVARRKATLAQMRDALFLRVGPLYSRRWDIPFPPDQRALLAARLADPPSKIGGRNVTKVLRVDGSKLFFSDDSWALLRPSGTEPIVRLYVETREEGEIETVARDVRRAFFG